MFRCDTFQLDYQTVQMRRLDLDFAVRKPKRQVFLRRGPYISSVPSENLAYSGIALCKVRIPKLADRVRILTLRGTIPELSVRKVRIGTK